MIFNIKVINHRKNKTISTTIRNVDAIIILSNDQYKVLFDNKIFDLTADSYDTKGKRKVYVRDAEGNWITFDRVCVEDRIKVPYPYIPFKPNYHCKGDVVTINDKQYFKVRASYNKLSDSEYNEACRFVKEQLELEDYESNLNSN